MEGVTKMELDSVRTIEAVRVLRSDNVSDHVAVNVVDMLSVPLGSSVKLSVSESLSIKEWLIDKG